MNKPLYRVISVALALSLSVTLAVNAYAEVTENSYNQETASAGYARKGQYVLFSTGENAMQLNTTKTTVNGNLYAGGDLNAYSGEVDVNGKTVLGGNLYKHNHTVWDSYIFEEGADKQSLDNEALDNAFTSLLGEDYLTHEYWYTYSGSEVTGDASIYAKSGLQYCADSVDISGTVIADSYMMISSSKVSTTDGEINMYVKNGNIGIYAGEVDIDGVLYAPNGTVQICATDVDISGMIIAKDIQISAQNVTISENLTLSAAQYVKCYEDQIFAINAEYNAESKNIDVALASTYPGGNYSIYTSYDGEDYLLNGTTTETSYNSEVAETADVIYIKAVQTYDNGVSLNSNIVKMVADEEKGFVQEYVDTDSDGLIDMYEHIFGSDTENPDTDGDGLSDFVEVMMSATDPLYIDSDEDEITDGNEDCDEDKLTNLQEIAYNTSIVSEDTDSDGLIDYDEIFVYGTKPENPDTDDDTINDGDEVSLGLDPLSADSDGDGTDDCKEKIKQTYVHDVENEDCAVDEVIVDIEATGNIQATMSVESVMGIDVLCTNVAGLVGEPFEINTTSEFDEATITFKVDTEKLDTEIDNLLFLWYDEENGIYKELETVVDAENTTISTTTTHFSKYMVVDRTEWYEAWSAEFNYNPAEDGTHGEPTIRFNTVLAIDCSGSMEWNDPDNQRASASEKFLEYMHDEDKGALVLFTDRASLSVGMTSEEAVLKAALKNIYSSGGTNFSVAINKSASAFHSEDITAINVNNRIILLSDGEDEGATSARNTAIQSCIDKNIKIYTVGFGNVNDSIMQNIADKTGGEYFKAVTSEELNDIFARIGYSSDFDMTDSDFDGLPDAVEIAGIRTQNGSVIRGCDYTNPDTDGDGLLDGEEINPTPSVSYVKKYHPYSTNFETIENYFFEIYSDPTLEDSDYDGIDDDKDTEKLYNSFDVNWVYNAENAENNQYKVSYQMDYSQFFTDNEVYNKSISVISSLFAATAYDGQYIHEYGNSINTDGTKCGIKNFMEYHGMSNAVVYQLKDSYDDQHITDVAIGHRSVTLNGKSKEIISISVRGTNTSTEEWSSNFDVGCYDIFKNNNPIAKNEDWITYENHMGFDITANRVKKLIDKYISNYVSNNTAIQKTLWITGHSRGGGIANILGSYYDSKYETFVYTFASPRTTTSSKARSYKSIFNIINDDDMIAHMPLKDWGFNRFGTDIVKSVNDNYKAEWKNYTGKDYTTSPTEMKGLIAEFGELATDRNDCYKYHCSCHGDGSDNSMTLNYMKPRGWQPTREQFSDYYRDYAYKYLGYDLMVWECQTTAYFMQYLAILAAKKDAQTALTNLAPKYVRTKNDFVRYSIIPYPIGNITNPHQQISYYVIAKKY